MTISEFRQDVQKRAAADNLSFGCDFDLLAIDPIYTVEVGKYTIGMMNDLSAFESWYFEDLLNDETKIRQHFNGLIRGLADKLRTVMALETRAEAMRYLLTGNPDWVDNDDYQKFNADNAVELNEAVKLFKLLQNNMSQDIKKITVFMICRYDVNWDIGNTCSLSRSVMEEIKALLVKEANRGQEPTPVEADETEGEDEEGKS